MKINYRKTPTEILKIISNTEMYSIRTGITKGFGVTSNAPVGAFEDIIQNYEDATEEEWNKALEEVKPIINKVILDDHPNT